MQQSNQNDLLNADTPASPPPLARVSPLPAPSSVKVLPTLLIHCMMLVLQRMFLEVALADTRFLFSCRYHRDTKGVSRTRASLCVITLVHEENRKLDFSRTTSAAAALRNYRKSPCRLTIYPAAEQPTANPLGDRRMSMLGPDKSFSKRLRY